DRAAVPEQREVVGDLGVVVFVVVAEFAGADQLGQVTGGEHAVEADRPAERTGQVVGFGPVGVLVRGERPGSGRGVIVVGPHHDDLPGGIGVAGAGGLVGHLARVLVGQVGVVEVVVVEGRRVGLGQGGGGVQRADHLVGGAAGFVVPGADHISGPPH